MTLRAEMEALSKGLGKDLRSFFEQAVDVVGRPQTSVKALRSQLDEMGITNGDALIDDYKKMVDVHQKGHLRGGERDAAIHQTAVKWYKHFKAKDDLYGKHGLEDDSERDERAEKIADNIVNGRGNMPDDIAKDLQEAQDFHNKVQRAGVRVQ